MSIDRPNSAVRGQLLSGEFNIPLDIRAPTATLLSNLFPEKGKWQSNMGLEVCQLCIPLIFSRIIGVGKLGFVVEPESG
jgi:hypothetical protein